MISDILTTILIVALFSDIHDLKKKIKDIKVIVMEKESDNK